MPIFENINGTKRKVKNIYESINGIKHNIKSVYHSMDGTIKKVFSINNRDYSNITWKITQPNMEDITSNHSILKDYCDIYAPSSSADVIVESNFKLQSNDTISFTANFGLIHNDDGGGASAVSVCLFTGTYDTGNIICNKTGSLGTSESVCLQDVNFKLDASNVDKYLNFYVFVEDPGDTNSNSYLSDISIGVNGITIFKCI